jgi:DNA topoisomerase I
MPRLRRVDCTEPGIHRVGRGRGFSYVGEDGEPIHYREVLEQIPRSRSARVEGRLDLSG